MPRVVHFEINADDVGRAVQFYTDVFGWKAEKWDGPIEYWLIMTGEGEPGIDGAISERQDPPEATVNMLDVNSVDEYVAKVLEHGGTVVVPKMAVPGVGWLAYCKDTEGNTLDTMTSSFQLGIWDAEVVGFTAAPQEVPAGATVDLSATLRNTGTVDISGEAVLRVTDEQGSTVSESRREVLSLPASESVSLADVWDTSDAAPGEYDIVCYMLYNGQATLASSATVTVSASGSSSLALGLGLGIGLGVVFALGILAVPWIRRRGGAAAVDGD